MAKVEIFIENAGLHAKSGETQSILYEIGPTCSYVSKVANHISYILQREFPHTMFRLMMNRFTYICYNIPDRPVTTDLKEVAKISMRFQVLFTEFENKLLLDHSELCNYTDHG